MLSLFWISSLFCRLMVNRTARILKFEKRCQIYLLVSRNNLYLNCIQFVVSIEEHDSESAAAVDIETLNIRCSFRNNFKLFQFNIVLLTKGCGCCKIKGTPSVQVTSHSPIFAFPHWHDYPEGNKNSGEKKKKLRLRVIELTQKSLAWVAGVN